VLRWYVIQKQTDGASIAVRHSFPKDLTDGFPRRSGANAARNIREGLPARCVELINAPIDAQH
jgi:hypothetical protein